MYDYVWSEVNKILLEEPVTSLTDATKTVNEVLFGFEDEIFLKLAAKFSERGGLLEDEVWLPISETMAEFEYGIFMTKNQSSGWDHFNVRNGNGNNCLDGRSPCVRRVGEILTWNNKTWVCFEIIFLLDKFLGKIYSKNPRQKKPKRL